MVVGYGPNEGGAEERNRFWNGVDRILDRVSNGYIACILEDLNEWIGDRARGGITGAFGVPGENDGRRLVEFCAERGVCVWVTQALSIGVSVSTQIWQVVKTEWR